MLTDCQDASSGIRQRLDPGRPLASFSQSLWGLDWKRVLPTTISGLTVVSSDLERAQPFIARHYPTIFEEALKRPVFGSTRPNGAKSRYYEFAGDFFEFLDGTLSVGLLICTPLDWSSYYVRSAALLPEYQGRQAIQHFLSGILLPELAQAGVERVELDTSPSNLAMMHIATRLRFNPTGTLLTERWGALVHFTRHLSADSERVFLDKFCAGPRYQSRKAHDRPRPTAMPRPLGDIGANELWKGGQHEEAICPLQPLETGPEHSRPEVSTDTAGLRASAPDGDAIAHRRRSARSTDAR